MPAYEFQCDACGRTFTLVMKIADLEKGGITCPHCGKSSVRRLLSGFFAKTSRKS